MSMVSSGNPCSSSAAREGRQLARGLGQRLEVGDLRADVALHAGHRDAGQRARASRMAAAPRGCPRRTCSRAGRSRCTGASAGRCPGSRAGVTAGRARSRRRQRRRAGDLVLALGVELADARVQPERAISSSVLPTPENTMRSGGKPARSARRSSPPETMSAPAPSDGSRRSERARAVGLAARSRRGAARWREGTRS